MDRALARWRGRDLPHSIACYRERRLPPLRYTTSVRCVPHGGGRREAGESPEAAPRREVLEATGWRLSAPRVLGFMHFHDPNPAPPDHPYLHFDARP